MNYERDKMPDSSTADAELDAFNRQADMLSIVSSEVRRVGGSVAIEFWNDCINEHKKLWEEAQNAFRYIADTEKELSELVKEYRETQIIEVRTFGFFTKKRDVDALKKVNALLKKIVDRQMNVKNTYSRISKIRMEKESSLMRKLMVVESLCGKTLYIGKSQGKTQDSLELKPHQHEETDKLDRLSLMESERMVPEESQPVHTQRRCL